MRGLYMQYLLQRRSTLFLIPEKLHSAAATLPPPSFRLLWRAFHSQQGHIEVGYSYDQHYSASLFEGMQMSQLGTCEMPGGITKNKVLADL